MVEIGFFLEKLFPDILLVIFGIFRNIFLFAFEDIYKWGSIGVRFADGILFKFTQG